MNNLEQYEKLLRQLLACSDDSPEADAIRDAMDPLWYAMSEDERTQMQVLSATLQQQSASPMQVFVCGGDQCPKDGQPHQWDGPELRTDQVSSSTCSKCGLAHIDWCMMNAP